MEVRRNLDFRNRRVGYGDKGINELLHEALLVCMLLQHAQRNSASAYTYMKFIRISPTYEE